MRLLCLLLSSLLAACASGNRFTIERLPTFDPAVAMRDPASPPPHVRVLTDANVPPGELIPFAVIGGSSQSSIEKRLERMIGDTIEFMPDAYSYAEGAAQQVGAVSQYIGFGLSTSSPVMAVSCRMILLREAPSVLPIRINIQGMLMAISSATDVTGLQEGDTVLSINGIPHETDPARAFSGPWWSERMRIKPGDVVQLVAVRPGSGKVTGTAKALPNPRTYLTAPAMQAADHIAVHVYKKGAGPVWATSSSRSDDDF